MCTSQTAVHRLRWNNFSVFLAFQQLPHDILGYCASIHINLCLPALSATNLCYMALYNNGQLVNMFQCLHTSSLNLFTNFHINFPGTQHQNQWV
jgi:hypothetical protein